MDKYPSHKKIIIQVMISLSVFSFIWLQYIPPVPKTSRTLNITSCQPGTSFDLVIQGKPDPCLKHKLQTLYEEEQKCDLICGKESYKASFVGSSTHLVQDRLFLKMIQLDPDQHCYVDDKCLIKCESDDLNRVLNVATDNQTNVFATSNYWLILYAWVLGASAMTGVATFQDAITTQCCDNHVSGETFGHQRLWASVGWGSSALIVGYLVDLASADKLLFDYSPAFKVMAILWIIDVFVINKLPVRFSILECVCFIIDLLLLSDFCKY